MASDVIDYPKINVSRFDPFQDKEGKWKPGVVAAPDELYKQLFHFKEGYYAQSITTLRELPNKKDRDKFKQEKLPAFTFSALIDQYRDSKNIKQHSGVLVIDIDKEGFLPYLKTRQQENPDYTIANFRDEISVASEEGFSNILAAALSASGEGIFLIFLIDPTRHLESFEAINWELQNNYGIKIDQSCKDVVRLRFCTYDKQAVIRPFTKVVRYEPPPEYLEWKAVQDKRLEDLKTKGRTFISNANAASQIINTSVNLITKATVGDRHNQILKAARLLGGYVATGVLTLEYSRDILIQSVLSRNDSEPSSGYEKTIDWGLEQGQLSPIHLHIIAPDDPQYEYFADQTERGQEDFKKFYAAILEHNRAGIPFADIEFESLCLSFSIDKDRAQAIASRLYRLNYDEHDFEKLVPAVKLKIFINKRWEIRRNVITGDLWIRTRKSGNPWTLLRIEDLWISISEMRYKVIWNDLTRLLNTDMVSDYNPFIDYFKRVHKAKKSNVDFINDLATYIEVDGVSHEFFTIMFKKMLVRAVKCALEESYVNRYVFVFASALQNTGKSWFIRWLSPWGMKNYYAENPLNDNKDDRIRMSEVFIYNLEELQALSKKDVNVLKAIISQGSSKERKPYERQSQTFPRRCSFFGSTNRTDFLIDDSNSRWLIFDTPRIDWQYREKFNIADIWAQAYDLYLNDFHCELTQKESAFRDEINIGFAEVSTEDELLQRFFYPKTYGSFGSICLTPNDIVRKLQELCNNPKLNVNFSSVGRALKKQKFQPKYINRIKTYVVAPINFDPAGLEDAAKFIVNSEDMELKYSQLAAKWKKSKNEQDNNIDAYDEPPF